jgi:hypothetical protein
MSTPVPDSCRRCGRPIRPKHMTPEDRPGTVQHRARGLCYPCYREADADDTLLDYAQLQRSHDDTVQDVAELRQRGVNSRAELSLRLGLSWTTIYQVLYRTGRQDLLIGLPAGGKGDRCIGDTTLTSTQARGMSRRAS